MGFFKELKKKLTTLNYEEKVKPEKVVKEKKVVDNSDKKLKRKQKKLDKYVKGLERTSFSFSEKIKDVFARNKEIDEGLFEELEDSLLMFDISGEIVIEVIGKVKLKAKTKKDITQNEIVETIIEELHKVYGNENNDIDIKEDRVNVIIMVGVNGVGKTTSIAKMANQYKAEGKKVAIAAADTFRAGAVEQLNVWAERIGIDIIKPVKEGVDPSSVVFDAVRFAKENNVDILIIDTAGRLQNKVNLMNQLAKMKGIISNEIPDAPHEVLLVVDSTTGQNGVSQAESFKSVTDVTGIILTKLDGTSKGGIIFSIKHKLKIPVKLIGLGEAIDDLEKFNIDSFVYGMAKGLTNEH